MTKRSVRALNIRKKVGRTVTRRVLEEIVVVLDGG